MASQDPYECNSCKHIETIHTAPVGSCFVVLAFGTLAVTFSIGFASLVRLCVFRPVKWTDIRWLLVSFEDLNREAIVPYKDTQALPSQTWMTLLWESNHTMPADAILHDSSSRRVKRSFISVRDMRKRTEPLTMQNHNGVHGLLQIWEWMIYFKVDLHVDSHTLTNHYNQCDHSSFS